MNVRNSGFFLLFILLAFQVITSTQARQKKKRRDSQKLREQREKELAAQKEYEERRRAELTAEKAAQDAINLRNKISIADYSAFIDDKKSAYDRNVDLKGYAEETNEYNQDFLKQLNLNTATPLKLDDYYFLPVSSDPTSGLKKGFQSLSPLTWHNRLKTTDIELRKVPSCDKGLWLEIARNLTDKATKIDEKYQNTDPIQMDLVAYHTFQYEEDMLRLFVILHELKVFIKKMYQMCNGIGKALEGPKFFLRESTFLFYKNLERRFTKSSTPIFVYDPFSTEQNHFLVRSILFREVLLKMHYLFTGKEYKDQLAIVENEAKQFTGNDAKEFNKLISQKARPLVKVIAQMFCTEQKGRELIKKYSPIYPAAALAFEKNLNNWVFLLSAAMSKDGNVRTMWERYFNFGVFSSNTDLMVQINVAKIAKCASASNIPAKQPSVKKIVGKKTPTKKRSDAKRSST